MSHVQLLLRLEGVADPIDLSEEVYVADVTIGKSMCFSLESTTVGVEPEGEATPTVTHPPTVAHPPTIELSAIKDVSLKSGDI